MARLEHAGHSIRTAEGLAKLIEGKLAEVEETDVADKRRELAELYLEAKQFDEAIEQFTIAIDRLGVSDPALEQQIIKASISKFDLRISEAEKAAADPDLDSEARRQLEGQVRAIKAEKLDVLLDSLRDRVKRYPNQNEDRMELARLLLEADELDEAVTHLQRLAAHPKLGLQASLYLGQCFAKKGVFDLAEEQFHKVLDGQKNMTNLRKEAVYDLGMLHRKLGNMDQAMAAFKSIYVADSSYRDVSEIVESSTAAG